MAAQPPSPPPAEPFCGDPAGQYVFGGGRRLLRRGLGGAYYVEQVGFLLAGHVAGGDLQFTPTHRPYILGTRTGPPQRLPDAVAG